MSVENPFATPEYIQAQTLYDRIERGELRMDQQLYGVLPIEYAYIELLALDSTDIDPILDAAEFMDGGTPVPIQIMIEDQGKQSALPLAEIFSLASKALLDLRANDPDFAAREESTTALAEGIISATNAFVTKDQPIPWDIFKSYVRTIIEGGVTDIPEQEWLEVIIPNAITSNRLYEIISAKQKAKH